MNKNKLTHLCHQVSKEAGLTFNSVMMLYFLERVLHRIADSEYKENIIFKGGFLLSNVLGIDTRTTVDIDFLMRNMKFSEEQIERMMEDTLKNELNSDIIFEVQGIERIKKEDHYSGFRISVLCKLDNIRQVVFLDIATGDVITPHPIDYQYTSIFKQENILISAYPLETILAEKLQTIYSKGFLNSRSKDYYDVHILYRLKKKEINTLTLREACERTFSFRNTEFNLEDINQLLEMIKTDNLFKNRWKVYSKKNTYVQGITFEEVVESAVKLLDLIK